MEQRILWPRLSFVVIVLALFGASRAKAEELNQLVSYTCDRNTDRIVIELRDASDEAGEAMPANKGSDSWNLKSLLIMRDDNNIGHLVWVRKRCQLSDGQYEVAISAAPENFNIQGQCGESLSAQAEIRFNHAVLFAKEFDRSCYHPDEQIYRQFILHARTHEVTLVS